MRKTKRELKDMRKIFLTKIQHNMLIKVKVHKENEKKK